MKPTNIFVAIGLMLVLVAPANPRVQQTAPPNKLIKVTFKLAGYRINISTLPMKVAKRDVDSYWGLANDDSTPTFTDTTGIAHADCEYHGMHDDGYQWGAILLGCADIQSVTAKQVKKDVQLVFKGGEGAAKYLGILDFRKGNPIWFKVSLVDSPQTFAMTHFQSASFE